MAGKEGGLEVVVLDGGMFARCVAEVLMLYDGICRDMR